MIPQTIDSLPRVREVLNALERCFLAGNSPGVKLAAGIAVELITGRGIGGRPLSARNLSTLNFAVSVTLLSSSMEEVLVHGARLHHCLPRILIADQKHSIKELALNLSSTTSGDGAVELALLGRPLSVELWDDEPEVVTIGLNYLAISRSENLERENDAWKFTPFGRLNLMRIDHRESLALSEMLSIMGIRNPYDMTGHEEKTPLNLTSVA